MPQRVSDLIDTGEKYLRKISDTWEAYFGESIWTYIEKNVHFPREMCPAVDIGEMNFRQCLAYLRRHSQQPPFMAHITSGSANVLNIYVSSVVEFRENGVSCMYGECDSMPPGWEKMLLQTDSGGSSCKRVSLFFRSNDPMGYIYELVSISNSRVTRQLDPSPTVTMSRPLDACSICNELQQQPQKTCSNRFILVYRILCHVINAQTSTQFADTTNLLQCVNRIHDIALSIQLSSQSENKEVGRKKKR